MQDLHLHWVTGQFLDWDFILISIRLAANFLWHIATNLGFRPNPCHSLLICNWNLNSLTAYTYQKVSLSRVYVTINKFDVGCLSETYLDSSNLSDDDNFNLPGYNVVRAVPPSNTKKAVFASISKTLFF